MSDISPIAKLQNDWFQLHDLDRAQAVFAIRQSGISTRQIAAQLQLSESLLRHLLQALQAPASDRALARKGKLSTNELVRRARTTGLRRTAKHNEELALERARASREAADSICGWLAQQNMTGCYGEQIIEEVRRELDLRQFSRCLPSNPGPIDLALDELIQRCEPRRPLEQNATSISWYAEWLCRWIFIAFPDGDVRDTGLDLALQRQWGR